MNVSQTIPVKASRRNRYFTLKNINTHELDAVNGFTSTQLLTSAEQIPKDATSIEQLTSHAKQSFFYPFIDDTKRYYLTMIDAITQQKITCQCCYWCRHPFSTIPIGCPIRYVPSDVVQTCLSEVTKEVYSVCQSIPKTIRKEYPKDNTHNIIENEYYETDGSFCSFNCALAFINDNMHRPIYAQSKHLLMRMYVEIFKPSKLCKINPAPSWRLLKAYGGFMDINEFRNSFTNFVYVDNDIAITKLPKVHSIGHIFEEQYIF